MDLSHPHFSGLSNRPLPHFEVLKLALWKPKLLAIDCQLLMMGINKLKICFRLSFWACCYISFLKKGALKPRLRWEIWAQLSCTHWANTAAPAVAQNWLEETSGFCLHKGKIINIIPFFVLSTICFFRTNLTLVTKEISKKKQVFN